MINEMALWLVKSAGWLAAFAVVYFLFLKNERYFWLKRIYLITGALVALMMPFIALHYKVTAPAPPVFEPYPVPEGIVSQVTIAEVQKFSIAQMMLVIYIAGMILVAVRIILHYIKLRKTILRSGQSFNGRAIVVKTDEYPSSFTFFNYVFINPATDEAELREIINHEMVHVNQQHWIDLVLAETVRILQWANPLAWIYIRFIKLNHEHMADEVALRQSSRPAFYKAALLNQMFRVPVISLSNSFNYSLNKNRFEMMKNIIWSPYRRLKVLLIVPVIAILVYAFADPEIIYATGSSSELTEKAMPPAVITTTDQSPVSAKTETQAVQDAGVNGKVLKNDGSPLKGANISVTGNSKIVTTDAEGRFVLESVKPEAQLLIAGQGYKSQMVKPEFGKEMVIKLEVDPEYAARMAEQAAKSPLVIIDGVITDKTINDLNEMMLNKEIGTTKSLASQAASEKYGEKAKYGAIEVITTKRALEMGIQIPVLRSQPGDFPTFMGKSFSAFRDWVISGLSIPSNLVTNPVWIDFIYVVKSDGTVTDVRYSGPDIGEASALIINKIKSSPRWEPAANPLARSDYSGSLNVRITPTGIDVNNEPYVVVEQMPMYPGGDSELLKFVAANTIYPEAAKKNNIQGRVIVRFCVNTDGGTEAISVLRGVDPLLDQEAVRVVSMLTGFQPGYQGGKAVPVWYMVPITFTLK